MPDPGCQALTREDVLAAALLTIGALTLYGWTRQDVLWGDGPAFLDVYSFPGVSGAITNHVLYLPAARLLGHLLDALSPFSVLSALSSVSGALAVGLTHLICRQLGGARLASAFAAILLGLSPAAWFFATTVEVHSFHLAAVCAGCLATLLAPWKRPVLALTAVAAVFSLLFLTHQTAVLLGPGWVVLVGCARRMQGDPFRARDLFLVVGPVLVLAMLGAIYASYRMRGIPFDAGLLDSADTVVLFGRQPSLASVWTEWLQPLFLLVPLALCGLVTRRRDRHGRTFALASLLLPSLVFFLWWGEPSRGGYLLATAPFLAALAALAAFPRSAVLPFGVLLAGAQGWAALGLLQEQIHTIPAGYVEQRVADTRSSLGDAGILLSLDPFHQPVTMRLPGVRELNLVETVRVSYAEDRSPEEFSRDVLSILGKHASSTPGAIAMDFGVREYIGLAPHLAPYLAELEAAVRQEYALASGAGAIVVLTPLDRN